MREHQSSFELPQLVDLPSGNVRILPATPTNNTAPPPAKSNDAGSHGPTGAWEVRDGDGATLEPTLESRAEALRYMCIVALRGTSLPLSLYAPDGKPTGDRLA